MWVVTMWDVGERGWMQMSMGTTWEHGVSEVDMMGSSLARWLGLPGLFFHRAAIRFRCGWTVNATNAQSVQPGWSLRH